MSSIDYDQKTLPEICMSLHMQHTGGCQDLTDDEYGRLVEYLRKRIAEWKRIDELVSIAPQWMAFDAAVLSLCCATLAEADAQAFRAQAEERLAKFGWNAPEGITLRKAERAAADAIISALREEDADLPTTFNPRDHAKSSQFGMPIRHLPLLAELYVHGDITPRAAADAIISHLREVIGDGTEVPARYCDAKIEIRFAIEGGRQIVVTCYPSGKATTGGPECTERAVTRKILGELGFKVGC